MNNLLKSFFTLFKKNRNKKNNEIIYYDLNDNSIVFSNLYINRDIPDRVALIKKHNNFLTNNAIIKLENNYKGLHGEFLIKKELRKLSLKNSICLHNVLLNKSVNSQQGSQFDFLLMTPKCIFIIESKWSSSEEIKFDKDNYFTNNHTYYNPKSQLANQWMQLYNTINSNQYAPLNNIPIFSILVYSNNANLLTNKGTDNDNYECICKLDSLNATIIKRYRNLKKEYDYSSLLRLSEDLKISTTNHIDNYHLYYNALHRKDYIHFKNRYICPNHNAVMQPRWKKKQEGGKEGEFFLVCPFSKNRSCKSQPIEDR